MDKETIRRLTAAVEAALAGLEESGAPERRECCQVADPPAAGKAACGGSRQPCVCVATRGNK